MGSLPALAFAPALKYTHADLELSVVLGVVSSEVAAACREVAGGQEAAGGREAAGVAGGRVPSEVHEELGAPDSLGIVWLACNDKMKLFLVNINKAPTQARNVMCGNINYLVLILSNGKVMSQSLCATCVLVSL